MPSTPSSGSESWQSYSLPQRAGRPEEKGSECCPEGGTTQCQAVTQDGARCKRKAQPGKKYCWQHANYKPAAKPAAKKGEAKPAAKKPEAKPAAK